MMSIYLREAGAVLGTLALIALIVFTMSWRTPDPKAPERLLEARIEHFGGDWHDLEKRNVVHATVKLPGGSFRTIRWPDDGRARHCRVGDTVQLLSKGRRLLVWRQGCYPTALDPNPPLEAAPA